METPTLEEELEDVRQVLIAVIFERWGQFRVERFESWLCAFRGTDYEKAESELKLLLE